MAKLPTSDARARRFRLRLPLQYRGKPEDDWRSGTTENISLSGVLFRAPEAAALRAPIEFSMLLPRELSGPTPLRVFGKGYVVRATQPWLGIGHTRIATAFLEVLLSPSPTVPANLEALAGAQHRIFNTLSVILGTSELLLDRKDLSADLHAGLARLQSAALVLAENVRDLAADGRWKHERP